MELFRRTKKNKSIVISYRNQRRLVGILGMILPLVCVLGGLLFFPRGDAYASGEVLDSISMYWHSNMRDWMVGILFAVGLFLFSYQGYDKLDTWITTLSSLAGTAIAVFPCEGPAGPNEIVGIFSLHASASTIVHMSVAVSFFLLLAFNSWFLFTKGPGGLPPQKGFLPHPQGMEDKSPEHRKAKLSRNIVYRLCALVMVGTMVTLLIIGLLIGPDKLHDLRLVLVGETIMLMAFGISWLVKGEALFPDPKDKALPKPVIENN